MFLWKQQQVVMVLTVKCCHEFDLVILASSSCSQTSEDMKAETDKLGIKLGKQKALNTSN